MNERVLIPWRSMPHAMKLERVKALTDEGKTASEIAAAFNAGIPAYNHTTRNAIIGFWGRNNIASKSGVTGGTGKWSAAAQAKAQETRARHRISAQVESERREAAGNRLNAQAGNLTRVLRRAKARKEGKVPGIRETATSEGLKLHWARVKAGEETREPMGKRKVMTVADLPVAGVPMLERTGFTCRSVREDKDELGLAMMCGSPVHREDSSWCEYHARLYTLPQSKRTGVRPNYARGDEQDRLAQHRRIC